MLDTPASGRCDAGSAAACSKQRQRSGSGSCVVRAVAQRRAAHGRRLDVPRARLRAVVQGLPGGRVGAQINYQAIGSGGGVEQFTAQTVDFGASDAPLQTDEIAALPATAVEIPTVLGGVAVAYNVPGVDDGPEARRHDGGGHLPRQDHEVERPGDRQAEPRRQPADIDITVVHRSDESGTTFVFTSWLSAESSEWNEGCRRRQGGPVADRSGRRRQRRRRGRDDADAGVDRLPLVRLRGDEQPQVATIKRDDGDYVAPSIESHQRGRRLAQVPDQPDHEHPELARRRAPIRSRRTTYLLVYMDQTDQDKGQTLVDFRHLGPHDRAGRA